MLKTLPDSILSLCLAYVTTGHRRLSCVERALFQRLVDDKVWAAVCFLTWGNRFQYCYFRSKRLCFETLSKWSRIEGYYSVLNVFPFGILVKIELISESEVVGLYYQSDYKSCRLFFKIRLDSSGNESMIPGSHHFKYRML